MSIYHLKSSPTPPVEDIKYTGKDRIRESRKVRGQGLGHAFKCSDLREAPFPPKQLLPLANSKSDRPQAERGPLSSPSFIRNPTLPRASTARDRELKRGPCCNKIRWEEFQQSKAAAKDP